LQKRRFLGDVTPDIDPPYHCHALSNLHLSHLLCVACTTMPLHTWPWSLPTCHAWHSLRDLNNKTDAFQKSCISKWKSERKATLTKDLSASLPGNHRCKIAIKFWKASRHTFTDSNTVKPRNGKFESFTGMLITNTVARFVRPISSRFR
jgi:hypothetical protein